MSENSREKNNEKEKQDNGAKKEKRRGERKYKKRTGIKAACVLVALVCCAASIAIVCAGITPERYDLSLGQSATADIVATKDIEDTITTEQNRQAAMDAVQTVYVLDTDKAETCLQNMATAFDSIVSVHDQGVEHREQWEEANPGGTYVPTTAYINELIKIIERDGAGIEADQELVLNIIDTDSAHIEEIRLLVMAAARNVFNAGLKQEDLRSQRDYIIGNIFTEDNGDVMLTVSRRILDKYMEANSLPDESATELARAEAAAQVESVVYRKGHYIVRTGDIITQAQLEMLGELGLLSNQEIDISMYAGVAALILIMLAIVAVYLYIYERRMLRSVRNVLLLSIIIVLILLIDYLLLDVETNLVQVYYATMLIGILLKTRLALITNLVLSVITGMMLSDTTGMFPIQAILFIIVSLISGTAAAYMCAKPMHRMRIMGTGLLVGGVGALTSLCVGLIIYDSAASALEGALWPLINGVASAVLCVGTLPLWELAFDIQTPTKLLELTNPNSPLLRRLALEAPGTYHHSIVVANLAESAADAIGANAMLVRAGAYYHDVGKLSAPEAFTENQTDKSKSIHNMLTPVESAALIRSHTIEGEELAEKYKLPKPIRDIIRQHHGTSTINYFYAQALEQDENVNIEDFKYPGPKPTSKEAALIMLADSVEAAVRSLPDKSPEKVKERILKLIKERVAAGELDQCDISMLELNKVAEEFAQALGAVHHERVEYPDLDKALADNRAKKHYPEFRKNDDRNS